MVSDCQHPGTPYILLHPPQILSLLTWSLQAPFSVSWGDLECRIALEDIGAPLEQSPEVMGLGDSSSCRAWDLFLPLENSCLCLSTS